MRFVQASFVAIAIICVLQFPVRTMAQEPSSGQNARPLTNQDVLQMVQAKFDDTTIVKMIQAHDANFDLSVGAMMSLKNAGVSQTVMQAMLSPSTSTSASAPAHSSVAPQPAASPLSLSPGPKTAASEQYSPNASPAPRVFAKNKKWDIPCQKVLVTGTQVHEITWSLKGEGLENNLYKWTCMQPVADATAVDAILDIEIQPNVSPIQKRQPGSSNYWVSCSSDKGGSYCLDSEGYSLYTSCNRSGCSSYYGPDPALALTNLIGAALVKWSEDASAWAYLFSAKDHKLLWKYEGIGPWHADLAKYSQCTHKFATQVCKHPKTLLQ